MDRFIYKYSYLFVAFLLLGLTLFYTKESFISSNARSLIHLSNNLPITSIEIECVREPKQDAWINLAEIRILDQNDKQVNYWEGGNSVNMANGNNGWNGYWGPIHHLYDGNINTAGHSSTAPDKMTIRLNPSKKISSIQITNRNDCCSERIQKYDLLLKHNNEVIGRSPLTNLGGNGKSVTYLIINPGPKGPPGIKGKVGPQGQPGPVGQTGIKGEVGPVGIQGEKGEEGNIGQEGDIGEEGDTIQGDKGDKGIRGIKGIKGLPGIRGKVGIIGMDGLSGIENNTTFMSEF